MVDNVHMRTRRSNTGHRGIVPDVADGGVQFLRSLPECVATIVVNDFCAGAFVKPARVRVDAQNRIPLTCGHISFPGPATA